MEFPKKGFYRKEFGQDVASPAEFYVNTYSESTLKMTQAHLKI